MQSAVTRVTGVISWHCAGNTSQLASFCAAYSQCRVDVKLPVVCLGAVLTSFATLFCDAI